MASAVKTLSNFIDGESVAWNGETEPVLNPATGEVLTHAPISTAEDVDRAVKAARGAFEGWSNTTPAQRAPRHSRRSSRTPSAARSPTSR